MKRVAIFSSVALLLVLVSIIVARADGPAQYRWGGPPWGHTGPLGYVAHQLNLSDAQKSEIKSMWEAEQPTIGPIVQELAAESKEMDAATAQGSLDEGKVQAIAAQQGETIAKLLVEKERLKSKVYNSVLTPEQRTKADQLQKTWHSRLNHIASSMESGGEGA